VRRAAAFPSPPVHSHAEPVACLYPLAPFCVQHALQVSPVVIEAHAVLAASFFEQPAASIAAPPSTAATPNQLVFVMAPRVLALYGTGRTSRDAQQTTRCRGARSGRDAVKVRG